MTNVAVINYSATGNVHALAQAVAVKGAEESGAEVRLRRVPELAPDHAIDSNLKQFLDVAGPLWAAGELANKAASGFTSAGNSHGGNESTLLALYNTLYHWGSIIVARATPMQWSPRRAAIPTEPLTRPRATPQGLDVLAAARYQAVASPPSPGSWPDVRKLLAANAHDTGSPPNIVGAT